MCLKIAVRQICVTLCGRVASKEGDPVDYIDWSQISRKAVMTTGAGDAQMVGMNYWIRSGVEYWIETGVKKVQFQREL